MGWARIANRLTIENAITGEALISLQHSDLKEMGIASIGHRMTILKSVYDIKVKQNVPLEEDDFVPQCKSSKRSPDEGLQCLPLF